MLAPHSHCDDVRACACTFPFDWGSSLADATLPFIEWIHLSLAHANVSHPESSFCVLVLGGSCQYKWVGTTPLKMRLAGKRGSCHPFGFTGAPSWRPHVFLSWGLPELAQLGEAEILPNGPDCRWAVIFPSLYNPPEVGSLPTNATLGEIFGTLTLDSAHRL